MPSVWFAHTVPDTRVLGKREVEVPRQASEPERAYNAAAAPLQPLGGSRGPGNRLSQEGC